MKVSLCWCSMLNAYCVAEFSIFLFHLDGLFECALQNEKPSMLINKQWLKQETAGLIFLLFIYFIWLRCIILACAVVKTAPTETSKTRSIEQNFPATLSPTPLPFPCEMCPPYLTHHALRERESLGDWDTHFQPPILRQWPFLQSLVWPGWGSNPQPTSLRTETLPLSTTTNNRTSTKMSYCYCSGHLSFSLLLSLISKLNKQNAIHQNQIKRPLGHRGSEFTQGYSRVHCPGEELKVLVDLFFHFKQTNKTLAAAASLSLVKTATLHSAAPYAWQTHTYIDQLVFQNHKIPSK